jgi:hypothetical protein
MALITDREAPEDVPTTNALDALGLGNDEPPPAYLAFGRSPKEMDNPPARGEIRTYVVRAKCKGIHEAERTDGEIRYSRSLEIIACWEQGQQPPSTDEDQPGLFDHGDDEHQDDVEVGDE